jgi:hypothetical protein
MDNSESWHCERPKPWREATAEEIASESIRLTNSGAQSTVFRLPDHLNYDASPTGSFYNTVEVSRVLKIAHSPKRAENAAASMGITDPAARVRKASQLIVDNRMSTTLAIESTKLLPRLDQLFGHPLSVPTRSNVSWRERHHFAYTQDFARPIWEIFAQLNPEHNEDDLREACRIIDLYIDAQLFLCSLGIFDQTFKLLDNCAMGAQEVLYPADDNAGFKIVDIGELSFYNLKTVLQCIREKEWRKTALRPEYTQMSPSVRAYFDAAFDARFTEDAVRSIWATGLPIELDAIDTQRDTADAPILHDVAEILWSTDAPHQIHLDK